MANGTLDPGEECDDFLTSDCTDCGFNVILDLNSIDSSSNNYSTEFFDLDEVVYFTNITNFNFRVSSIRVR